MNVAAMAWMNECDGWSALGLRSSAMYRVEERHGLVCAWRVYDVPYMPNYIHVPTSLTGALPDLLQRPDLRALMEDSDAVTEIRLLAPDASSTRLLEHELAGAGFRRTASMPIMVRDGKAKEDVSPTDQAAKLEIRKAVYSENPHDFEQAFRIIHQVFGGPLVMNQFFLPKDGAVIPYYALLDGQPVSAAVVWCGLITMCMASTVFPRWKRTGARGLPQRCFSTCCVTKWMNPSLHCERPMN